MNDTSSIRYRFAVTVPLFVLSLSWSSPATPSTPPALATEPEGVLTVQKDAIDALILMGGFDKVYAFSWKGGRLGGIVNLDGLGKPDDRDIGKRFDLLNSMLVSSSKVALDSSRTSGLVVFAIHKAKGEPKVRECLLGIQLSGETVDGKRVAKESATVGGTIPDFSLSSDWGGGQTFSIVLPDGQKREVFRINLVPTKPIGNP
jgi:hypothetical protein